jgi:uncharacterized membrane protein (UPF0182 family)
MLAVILVLFVAWGFRLAAYTTLITGSGLNGAFTRVDHQWVLPTNLTLSFAAVGAAVVLFVAGWVGQLSTALVTTTLVLGAAFASKVMLPWLSHLHATDPSQAAREAPYLATQRLYTARAFPAEATPLSSLFAADSTLLAAVPKLRGDDHLLHVVYPGARGVFIDPDTSEHVLAPRLGRGMRRILVAWAEQNPRLLRGDLDASTAIVQRRDVRDRVALLAPIFTQSRTIGARPGAHGIVWIADLYVTSEHYPLSVKRPVGDHLVTYRHHAATAYVTGTTGAVTIVPDSVLEPVSRAWFARHPGRYLSSHAPALVGGPGLVSQPGIPVPAGKQDRTFQLRVLMWYMKMRAALDSGNFHAFGDAFDSLGAAVGAHK